MIQWTTIWLLQITIALSAPLQFPLLHLQGTMQQQQLALQEQMLALHQFQEMQRLSAMPMVPIIPPQPLLILLPKTRLNNEQDDRNTKINGNKPLKLSEGIEDDTDSISIDAMQNDVEDNNHFDSKNMKAILLVPNNARFSIGGIISAIPFLPFEINVPDSISWIWNAISSIPGQIWPGNAGSKDNLKSVWKEMKSENEMPIVVIPLGQPMFPMQY